MLDHTKTTDQFRSLIQRANRAARSLNHQETTVLHALLALSRFENTARSWLTKNVSIGNEELEAVVSKYLHSAAPQVDQRTTISGELQSVIELSFNIGTELGLAEVSTKLFLLAMMQSDTEVATILHNELGVERDALHEVLKHEAEEVQRTTQARTVPDATPQWQPFTDSTPEGVMEQLKNWLEEQNLVNLRGLALSVPVIEGSFQIEVVYKEAYASGHILGSKPYNFEVQLFHHQDYEVCKEQLCAYSQKERPIDSTALVNFKHNGEHYIGIVVKPRT